MSKLKIFIGQYKIGLLIAAGSCVGLIFLYDPLRQLYHVLADREAVKGYIASWGASAPLIFILIQVLQVIIAPVPGEVSGFVGGYLFGALKGFFYSSIGLTIGSVVNFWIGRILGYRFVRKLIPPAHLEKLDAFISHQGIIVLLVLFIFPGFPKDYLCLFLGLTTLPFNIFFVLAAFGRMPGTLMLSIQGQFLYHRNYLTFLLILFVGAVAAGIAARYKEAIYRWAERENKRQSSK